MQNRDLILETERLILAPWQAADWTRLRPLATDPEVMRYITGGEPWTDERIRSFVDQQVQSYRESGFCRWKLLEKTAGETVGFCGVGSWHGIPEIGWWLARRHWGRGFATEAARLALDDIFARIKLDRVFSVARPENAASIRIMEKLGLRFFREFEYDAIPLVQYAIDRAQYASPLDSRVSRTAQRPGEQP